MFIFVKMGWRNLFRNKRRTFLAGLAIGMGLAGLMVADAFMLGMTDNMVRAATETFTGHGQIHRRGFRKTHEVEKTVTHYEQVIENLRQEEDIRVVTERTISFSMITSPANVNSVMLFGIRPETEKQISKLDEALINGSYVSDQPENRIMIGWKLAEVLEVGLNDRVVVTLAQAETGEMSQEMFRVGGIFRFGIRQMDMGTAFVHIEKAQAMLNIGSMVHEIAFFCNNLKTAGNIGNPLWEKFSDEENQALSWKKLIPELSSVLEMSDFGIWIITTILFGIVAVVIVNTLFMAMYERLFEFGVLRTIGTRPLRMALMILFEAASLAVISIVIGIAIGTLANHILGITGLDYTGLEFVGVTISEYIYPVMRTKQFTFYPTLLFFFTVIIGIYPAIHAARITPSKALRRSL